MNEQLRKAIEEATEMFAWREDGIGELVVRKADCNASQAKLLRVIELLVEQRDDLLMKSYEFNLEYRYVEANGALDAELIAALEGKP